MLRPVTPLIAVDLIVELTGRSCNARLQRKQTAFRQILCAEVV